MRLDVALASGLAINVRLDIADCVARRATGRALLRGRTRDEVGRGRRASYRSEPRPRPANDVVDTQTERHVEEPSFVCTLPAHAIPPS